MQCYCNYVDTMIVKSNQDEIQQYLSDQANDQNISISVCGNHTGLTGASFPVFGWVLLTENLNQII